MKNTITRLLVTFGLSFLCGTLCLAQNTSTGYPITDYLGMTFFEEVQVSPSGRQVAFITARDDFEKDRTERAVWLVDVDAGGRKTGMRRLTTEAVNYFSLKWSPDGRFVSFLSNSNYKPGGWRPNADPAHLFVIDVQAGKQIALTEPKDFKDGLGTFDWAPDSKSIVFNIGNVFYRLPVSDFGLKPAQQFAKAERRVTEFVHSPDGKTIAYRPRNEIFLIDIASGKQTRRLTDALAFVCVDPSMMWTKLGLSYRACGGLKDGKFIRTQRRLYVFDAENGKMDHVALEFEGELNTDYSILEDGSMISVGTRSTRNGIYRVAPRQRDAEQLASFPGFINTMSASADGKLVAFSLTTNQRYGELYLGPGTKELGKAVPVTEFNLTLSQMPRPEIETISWNNGEGDSVEGILYYPPDKKGAKNLPFVVVNHGGPWGAFTEGLERNYLWGYYQSLLASRGYLVLAPNYRGSTGRGDAFLQNLLGYPCSRPATDVMTGVDHVVSLGFADPDRMGIMGTSYGGVVTNCVIGRTKRFKVAVSTSGHWNLTSAFGTGGFQMELLNNKAPWEDQGLYWEESAISRAANIKTPTLLTTGANDPTVHPTQAQEMSRALDRLDVPNRLFLFPGEGHEFTKPSNKKLKVETEIAWLDGYILGKATPK